jgi:DNA-directed RNA polymerase specialized sigma24 family protein
MTREELFLSELALIERVIAWVCARRCLRAADAEDFASTVKLRIIENDYEILGRFEGRSSLRTYLTRSSTTSTSTTRGSASGSGGLRRRRGGSAR